MIIYIALYLDCGIQYKTKDLQNSAAKVISAGKDHVSTEEMEMLHDRVRLLFLSAYKWKLMLNLVLKCKRRENLDRPSIVLRGRHKIKMKLPYSNKDQVLKSPSYMSFNLWNQLDEETQSIEAREEFKRKLRLIHVNRLQYWYNLMLRFVRKYVRVKLVFI